MPRAVVSANEFSHGGHTSWIVAQSAIDVINHGGATQYTTLTDSEKQRRESAVVVVRNASIWLRLNDAPSQVF